MKFNALLYTVYILYTETDRQTEKPTSRAPVGARNHLKMRPDEKYFAFKNLGISLKPTRSLFSCARGINADFSKPAENVFAKHDVYYLPGSEL